MRTLYLLGVLGANFKYTRAASIKATCVMNTTCNNNVELPSFGIVDSVIIREAEIQVEKALQRISLSNQLLIENPRKNTYINPDESNADVVRHIKNKGIYPNIAKEETRAAAILAEYHALHEYHSGDLSTRSTNLIAAPFWMEQIGHSGQMPFGGDPNYKVGSNSIQNNMFELTM
jgi:hypothetical protein